MFLDRYTTLRFLSSISHFANSTVSKWNNRLSNIILIKRNWSPLQVIFFIYFYFFCGGVGGYVLYDNYRYIHSMLHIQSTHYPHINSELSINMPVNTAILTCQLGHMMTPNRVSEFFFSFALLRSPCFDAICGMRSWDRIVSLLNFSFFLHVFEKLETF